MFNALESTSLARRLPWDFHIGPGTDSERRHLEDIVAKVPAQAFKELQVPEGMDLRFVDGTALKNGVSPRCYRDGISQKPKKRNARGSRCD